METYRSFLLLGACLGLVAVAAGAFGAHGLRDWLGTERLATFETAARYQMIHALALWGVGLAAARWPDAWWTASGALFIVGILMFCGALYALSLTGLRWLGAIAPVGGVCLLAGWGAAAVGALRSTGPR